MLTRQAEEGAEARRGSSRGLAAGVARAGVAAALEGNEPHEKLWRIPSAKRTGSDLRERLSQLLKTSKRSTQGGESMSDASPVRRVKSGEGREGKLMSQHHAGLPRSIAASAGAPLNRLDEVQGSRGEWHSKGIAADDKIGEEEQLIKRTCLLPFQSEAESTQGHYQGINEEEAKEEAVCKGVGTERRSVGEEQGKRVGGDGGFVDLNLHL